MPEQEKKRSTPWGAIIGLVLILAIVVAGACYSFMQRYQPSTPSVGAGTPSQSY